MTHTLGESARVAGWDRTTLERYLLNQLPAETRAAVEVDRASHPELDAYLRTEQSRVTNVTLAQVLRAAREETEGDASVERSHWGSMLWLVSGFAAALVATTVFFRPMPTPDIQQRGPMTVVIQRLLPSGDLVNESRFAGVAPEVQFRLRLRHHMPVKPRLVRTVDGQDTVIWTASVPALAHTTPVFVRTPGAAYSIVPGAPADVRRERWHALH